MHFGIFTYGSRGDVQPYVALALGLMSQRDEVTLFAPENFREFVESYGVRFGPLYGDAEAILHAEDGLKALDSGNVVSLLRLMAKASKEIQPRVNRDLLAGSETVDVLIANVLCLYWIQCIAEKLNKPWAVLQVSLPSTPTREFPFAGLAFLHAPWYNRFSHQLIRYIYWRLNKKAVNDFRKELSLPPVSKNPLDAPDAIHALNLYAISPSMVPRPKDWPANTAVTGFIQLSSSQRARSPMNEIPAPLQAWLRAYPRPVYIGFGSIPVANAARMGHIIMDILSSSDFPILFARGWSSTVSWPAHPRLFVIDQVNHEWLFPQCRAVVFHGGVGTMAAALKAGVPMVILSVFVDQPWWGQLIQKQKLGIHLPFKKIGSSSLLKAIKKTEQPEIREQVADMRERLAGENGIELALELVRSYFLKKQD